MPLLLCDKRDINFGPKGLKAAAGLPMQWDFGAVPGFDEDAVGDEGR